MSRLFICDWSRFTVPMRGLRCSWLAAVLLGGLLLVGCGSSRETVSVVDRPEPPSVAEKDSAPAPQEVVSIPSKYDTVQAQRFDRGKMWTFENPPIDYFRETYDVEVGEEWMTNARRGALRFGEGCSASFVSPNGLVLTNHHCAREHVANVSRSDEDLLDNGFYAQTLDQERRDEELHVDRLVEIEDVTKQVYSGLRRGGDARAQAREQRVQRLEEKLTEAAQDEDSQLRVEVRPLYRGAKYSAYTYRRYDDVRLVMVPELQLGFFGGSTDNFTYPRHALDVAFFRVYDEEGRPLQTEHHFSWNSEGAQAGDPVFAVGHPGSTSRLEMVSQLEYKRDYEFPNRLETLRSRSEMIESFIRNHPDTADRYNLRNTYFSVENSMKGLEGQLRGLRDPYLLARRGKAVQALQDSIVAVDSLQQNYGRVIREIQRLQRSKEVMANKAGAFVTFSNVRLGSRILARAVHGYYYDFLRTRGAQPDRVQSIRADGERIADWPAELEENVITAQLREIREAFGQDHPTVQRLLSDRSPEELASHLVENSALMDSSAFAELLEQGYRKSKDPSVPVIEALAPMYLNTNRQMQDIRDTERNLNARLSQARFAIFGSYIPPDATGSLRISDGRIQSYHHSGTVAPPFTNFYGLYDHYYSHRQDDWALPGQWVEAPDSLDLKTPLNLVSTNDISAGSSGSPLLNEDLEVVGVVFDSNMEALPNEYLYRKKSARAISVDVRGILEALESVYGAEPLVEELTSGELRTAQEAEAAAMQ